MAFFARYRGHFIDITNVVRQQKQILSHWICDAINDKMTSFNNCEQTFV